MSRPGGVRERNGKSSVSPLLVLYIAALAAGAAAIVLVLARGGARAPGVQAWAALPAVGLLLVAAESLFVRFRYAGQINALNLVEAILAPLLYAFPGPVAVATVAAAQVAGGVLRHNAPEKAAFNVAQWSLAAGVGSLIVDASIDQGISWGTTILTLLAVLAVIGIINQVAFTLVLAIANRESPGRLLRGLAPVMVPGWIAGWAVNSLIGLLFVFAYAAHPASVVLFPVPLIVLHLAYRGYAGARSDRVRLAGLHSAARVLGEPLDPTDAVGPFLREVAHSFEARAAALVFRTDDARIVHRVDMDAGGTYHVYREDLGSPSLEAALLAQPEPIRITAEGRDSVAAALRRAGRRDCLAAPILDGGHVTGALLVLDQAGLEGFEAGELAVVEALARETAGMFSKGKLLGAILEERRKLSEIVTSTSDGIMTLDLDGLVRSWNPAMERITGLGAVEVTDRRGALAAIDARTISGAPVILEAWASGESQPRDIRIRSSGGSIRRLSCSYSVVRDADGAPQTLVVVARDATPVQEMELLRQEFGRLAEAEAAQRAVVEQLQEAVMPARPALLATELGVSYQASDPTAPTGGDLYDWQVLPNGELHVTVVDVLGHGVAATRNALSVVHALRLLALEGVPLEDTILRADRVLGAQNPDLVATVIVGRFDPRTGRVRLAGGGHPPALLLSSAGGVRQVPVPGGAIGWPMAGSEAVAQVDLAPGDALLLYTDGLVESSKDILEGTEALIRHARALMHLPAEDLAATLVERSLAAGSRRDDSLALVLRRQAVPARASWSIPPDGVRAADARHGVAQWLERYGIAGPDLDELSLIAAELLSNAVAAARTTVELRASFEGRSVVLEVEDDGPGRSDLDRLGFVLPDTGSDRGRGLFIVRRLSDDVTILSTFEGTVVRSRKRLRESGDRARAALFDEDTRRAP